MQLLIIALIGKNLSMDAGDIRPEMPGEGSADGGFMLEDDDLGDSELIADDDELDLADLGLSLIDAEDDATVEDDSF